MKEIFENCNYCGKRLIGKPESMLVINDALWNEINKKSGNKNWICPECMIKLNEGRKFKYSELKKNLRGAVIPCNIWYILDNGMIKEAIEDFKKETKESVLRLYKKYLGELYYEIF